MLHERSCSVKGAAQTVLYQKDTDKEIELGNFRSISCLPLIWKLLIGVASKEFITIRMLMKLSQVNRKVAEVIEVKARLQRAS